MNYLRDLEFLQNLEKENLKVHYAKIILLSFDEKPLKEIQGMILNGTLNINGNSSVRRTITLSMIAEKQQNNLTNLDNLISLNKKVKVLVGYKNLLIKKYPQYGEIIWFPCGMFIINSASLTYSSTGCNISFSGQDKMCLLNGSAGGVLQASTTFHEAYIIKDNGDIEVTYPTIRQIILEAVNHLGGEALTNIFINDLDETAKLLTKYNGDTPIRFNDSYSSYIISNTDIENYNNIYEKGQDVGYQETPFTYPGELVFDAGTAVTNVLDKICSLLGNFEYFYDINGRFIFQEIKNYLNNNYSFIGDNNINGESYIKAFSDTMYIDTFNDNSTILSLSVNPKYDNIKNDFIVWGTGDELKKVRYHLVIDKKPDIDLANKYMWKSEDGRYLFTDKNVPPAGCEETNPIGIPCTEWREELYRGALSAQLNGDKYSDYDQELLAEWRKIFDTTQWENGWNPEVANNPKSLSYWLDFIDSSSSIGSYSVSQIGRRTKIINDSNITAVLNNVIPDIILLQNPGSYEEIQSINTKYSSIGQKFCFIYPNDWNYFVASSSGASCFDRIRELLYQYLTYNMQITISCLPKYYLEPNNLIHVQNTVCGIEGDFVITQMSIPLNYNNTMSITAAEALKRV